MRASPYIQDILKRLPQQAGVYQYYDSEGNLLYVGKAKDLKKRVSSYFTHKKHENSKTKTLVKQIAHIEFLVVPSEFDALLLENNLIKTHQPKYNIMLKDDKTYPFITIKKERFPRVLVTRTIVRDGSEYFGPYASVKTMHVLLDLIRQLFPLRTCQYNLSEQNIAAKKFSVCLEYHLGNCLGPCEGKMDELPYNQNIDLIRTLLKGHLKGLIKDMETKMQLASDQLHFEEAHQYQYYVAQLKRYQAKSTVVHPSISDVDVFSVLGDSKAAYVNYMRVIDGAIVQGHTEEYRKRLDEEETDILAQAIIDIRQKTNSSSKQLILPFELDLPIPGVQIHVPQRGDKKTLLDLSKKNAFFTMKDHQKKQEMADPGAHQDRILENMKQDLHLKALPVHIECFDNSNIQGSHPASACVVFKNGKPSKKDYRKFNIESVEGPNDFASMEEVVFRRYRRLLENGDSLPQLIIIDGGKGQLSSALTALDRLSIRGQIAIIGIAKRLEEIYFPGDQYAMHLDKRSSTLKLIQQLRNEAHRFSLEHHRNRRSQAFVGSELDQISGVGPATTEKLFAAFGTIKNVEAQTQESLEAAVGKTLAKKIWDYFHVVGP